jgi:hypothetical protein
MTAIEAAAEALDEAGYGIRNSDELRTALEAAEPHMLEKVNAKLDAVRELHAEDLFRGHLSNGCKTCGNVGDIGYPCPTIIALDSAL